MKEKTIHLLELVWNHFKKFANDFALFALLYGRIAFITIGLSILIPTCLHAYLGMPHNVSMIIARIFLTVTPIIPTIFFVKYKDEDYSNEYSMDLCFAAWLITIVFAWWIM